ncbi:hypothetical protein DFO66_10838 [Brevibacterium sanguinis]|uniref:Uncharacterized protein n=2 Tax=Brevibacterium TaxID=1696 RepID=A0A366IHG9_9MICO|nr:hypothetical protein DFO66_10838 [Brevibacterium sanguinis]RBP70783.1 hypothetical protein DFO65_107101 [Brevibacterium celere]
MSTVSSVARGRVRRTSRNSADRWATASHPAKAKNSTTTAWPIPAIPVGAKGVNAAPETCGTATTITVRSIPATPSARPICSLAPTATPARLAHTVTPRMRIPNTGAQCPLRSRAAHR